jgi:hypothetical protein
MIHHISIAARDPRHVAAVLAELWGGHSFPFPPIEGAFIAMPGDTLGTAVEVSPLGEVLVPGGDGVEAQSLRVEGSSEYTATHAALSVPVREERVREIAAREGWRAETFTRGGVFRVVEFWIENRVLVELLTPDMQGEYLDFMTPEKYAALFGFPYTPRAEEDEHLELAGAGGRPLLRRGFDAFW